MSIHSGFYCGDRNYAEMTRKGVCKAIEFLDLPPEAKLLGFNSYFVWLMAFLQDWEHTAPYRDTHEKGSLGRLVDPLHYRRAAYEAMDRACQNINLSGSRPEIFARLLVMFLNELKLAAAEAFPKRWEAQCVGLKAPGFSIAKLEFAGMPLPTERENFRLFLSTLDSLLKAVVEAEAAPADP